MALIKCEECGNEISSEAKACPKCGKVTNTGEILAKKSNINLSYLGILIGLGIGYSMCPKIPLLGKVPLFHIVTGGVFLNGLDALLRSYAQQSFIILFFGAIAGLLLGKVIEKQFNNYPSFGNEQK